MACAVDLHIWLVQWIYFVTQHSKGYNTEPELDSLLCPLLSWSLQLPVLQPAGSYFTQMGTNVLEIEAQQRQRGKDLFIPGDLNFIAKLEQVVLLLKSNLKLSWQLGNEQWGGRFRPHNWKQFQLPWNRFKPCKNMFLCVSQLSALSLAQCGQINMGNGLPTSLNFKWSWTHEVTRSIRFTSTVSKSLCGIAKGKCLNVFWTDVS